MSDVARIGRLIICATPIGNLGDASPRLAATLESADVVFAEDTRRSGQLLVALGVHKPLRSYFVGNEHRRGEELAGRLSQGEIVVLITDAGTPAVADPGLSAVRVARQVGAEIAVVPGPSAVTAALAVSGLSADRFVFEGFLPRKGSARTERLVRLAAEDRTIVLFAATRRVGDDLAALGASLGHDREVVVGRELTKMHEEVWAGTLAEAAERWSGDAARGEFTLVVAGAPAPVGDLDAALAEVATARREGASLSAAVRDAAQRHGVRRRELYELAVRGDAAGGDGTDEKSVAPEAADRQAVHRPRLRKDVTSAVAPQKTHTASRRRITMASSSTEMANSSPSVMLNRRRVSAGTTIRPRSSILRTIPIFTRPHRLYGRGSRQVVPASGPSLASAL